MPPYIGGKASFICNINENKYFSKYIEMTARRDGKGMLQRKNILVVTGKDSDNRFIALGPQRETTYVTVGRSGYVDGSAL